MTWDGNRPNTLPRLDQQRLLELAADRTGWDQSFGPRALTDRELLALVDELIAWRRHKLTEDEKARLRELANSADPIIHADAIAAIRRIAPAPAATEAA